MNLREMIDDLYEIEWMMHRMIRDYGNNSLDFERSVKGIVNSVQEVRHAIEQELGI